VRNARRRVLDHRAVRQVPRYPSRNSQDREQIKLENVIEIGSREAIREAVLRNIGVSIIARHEVPDSQELRIVTIHQAALLDEFLYCLKERRAARLIDDFLQVAQKRFVKRRT
jgi:DNA-binding transcriptional LysR family regulator